MESWERLLEQVRACTICQAELPLGPRPVVQMHPDARILIAAQAPGRKVHASGRPFDDASGERLRDWLGVTPATFYDPKQMAIIPMGFCYPGTGKAGDMPPRPECAPAWRKPLLAELPNLELTLVIGKYAHDWHLDKRKTVTEHVKDWEALWPQVVPLPHPSPRNNMWLRRNPWFEAELIPRLRARVGELLTL